LQAFLEAAFRAWLPHLDHAGWYLWHAHMTQGFFAAAAAADVLIHRQIIWVKSGFNLTRSGMYHWAHEPCFFGWVRGQQPPWYGEKNQRSVWEIDRNPEKGMHPTQKPADLWHAPIQNHTKPGEVCAEPFAGSGSQFVAAEQTGRLCYGMEICERYVAIALERLSQLGLTPRKE
jgi:DNA modification methylase